MGREGVNLKLVRFHFSLFFYMAEIRSFSFLKLVHFHFLLFSYRSGRNQYVFNFGKKAFTNFSFCDMI